MSSCVGINPDKSVFLWVSEVLQNDANLLRGEEFLAFFCSLRRVVPSSKQSYFGL